MAAITRKQYKGAAAQTTITSGINAAATTVQIAANTGWPTGAEPFYVVISPGTAAEEKCLATISSTTLTLTRGQDDTTAQTHSSGATIYPVFSADEADEANFVASRWTTKGDLVTFNGTDVARQGVGTNGHVLTADSAQTNGIKWALSPETDLVTTKGDLLVATAADTLARQGVGENGSVLMADSAQTNGIAWSAAPTSYRNKIINGRFDVWQRGTSFTNPASAAYTADRWSVVWDGSGATRTISRQTFTPGGAPVSGHEAAYFFRFNQSVAGSGATYNLFQNRMEDVRTFANQTVTVSFWAKAAANLTLASLNWEQNFGTGGSPSADVSSDFATNVAITTSWARYSYTVTVPSISGKTIGTTAPGYLGLRFFVPNNSTFTLDVWGVQVEAGSVATPFEFEDYGTTLAKCQRYFTMFGGNSVYELFGLGWGQSTTRADVFIQFPVQLRAIPTASVSSAANFQLSDSAAATVCTSIAFDANSGSINTSMNILATVASGLTQYRPYRLEGANTSSARLNFSAEL